MILQNLSCHASACTRASNAAYLYLLVPPLHNSALFVSTTSSQQCFLNASRISNNSYTLLISTHSFRAKDANFRNLIHLYT